MPPRKTKLDLLIVAARYRDGWLDLAKGYRIHGQVWTDVLLFPRDELIELLQSGARIGYGRNAPLATDFEVEGTLKLEREGDRLRVVSGGSATQGDDLGVPIF